MSKLFSFPPTVFTKRNDFATQLIHIASEFNEVSKAFQDGESPERVAEEMIDAIHSLETGLRILQQNRGIDVDVTAAEVMIKNARRGYYLSQLGVTA